MVRPVKSTSSTSTTTCAGEVDGDVGDGLGQHRPQPDVVAVEGHVERADRAPRRPRSRSRASASRSASGTPPVCRPTSTTLVEAVVALDDLVGDAGDGPAHVVGVHDLGPGNENAPVRGRRSCALVRPSWVAPSSVRASRDPLHGQDGLSSAPPPASLTRDADGRPSNRSAWVVVARRRRLARRDGLGADLAGRRSLGGGRCAPPVRA